MLTRIDHLKDTEARLSGKTGAAASVHRSRSLNTADDELPAILLYAPDEEGAPIGGGVPQFNVSVSLAIEVRVKASDDWDTAATDLMEEIKALLFADPAWLARWRKAPRYRIRQYIEDKHDRMLCGEVMTLDLEDAATAEFVPADGPTLEKAAIDIDGLSADPDGDIDVNVIANVPPE